MKSISDFPDVSVGPDNPYRVELDQTAEVVCRVDSKPPTETVRWEFSGRFIDTNFRHVIPQVNKPVSLKDNHKQMTEAPVKKHIYYARQL